MRITAGSRAALLLIAFLTAATPAPAAVVPLATVPGDADVAIAGDRVVLFETLESGVRVRTVPVAGGPESVVFEAPSAPGDSLRIHGWGSAERLAFIVIHDRTFEDEFRRELYAGPPGGPFSVVTSGVWGETAVPASAQVTGSTMFWGAWGPDLSQPYRWMAESPDGPRQVPVPGRSVGGISIAGDVAGAVLASGRYVVFDHGTGEPRVSVDLVEPDTHAVRSDGIAVIEDDRLLLASPTRVRTRRLRGSADVVGFAGDRVIGVGPGSTSRHLRAIPLDGGRGRRVGPATRHIDAAAAEEAGRVAWIANGCVVIAAATDGPVRSLGPGPCPRVETRVGSLARDVVLGHRKSLPVRLRCVAAPGACRGRIELVPGTRQRSFAVRVGRTETVRVPLSADARRHLRREFRRDRGNALIGVRATAADPAGRTSVSQAHLLVFRDVAARRRGR